MSSSHTPNSALPQSSQLPLAYQDLQQVLVGAGIQLQLQRKRVKNINFRLKPYLLSVSAPARLSHEQIAQSIEQRLEWVLTQHPKIVAAQLARQQAQPNEGTNQEVRLWGEVQRGKAYNGEGEGQKLALSEAQRLAWYREELAKVMPSLFAKWQPIVGKAASEQRIKKMTTRWGSCNVRARRVWLSVYLPAYPIECTEYVIVHELCHLRHANHSKAFWQEVAKAMPDYQQWHNMLAGRGDGINGNSEID